MYIPIRSSIAAPLPPAPPPASYPIKTVPHVPTAAIGILAPCCDGHLQAAAPEIQCVVVQSYVCPSPDTPLAARKSSLAMATITLLQGSATSHSVATVHAEQMLGSSTSALGRAHMNHLSRWILNYNPSGMALAAFQK